MSARILIVDDDQGYRFSLRDYLAHLGYRITEAGSCAEARQILKSRELDLILLDLQLPDGDGLALLDEIAQMGDAVEVIMISGHGTIEKAVQAMQKGACDFVPKPGEMSDLVARIKKALELRGLKRRSAGRTDGFTPPIVGKSKQMTSCLEACRRLAQTDTTVLLLGETGTGKEILARYLHAVSPRRDGPFVAVSCANFTEQLIDDDLFGHESGAFTGAHKVKQGKVESADGGTLFLDEIGEMPYALQAKLLRFLEMHTYTRVGGVKERETDVRVVAATNRNLQAETKEGRFRPDLFFRLNVYSLYIPPLREWRESIPDLVGHFLSQMACKQSRNGFTITPEALERLMEYHWPGNVRELRNVIERATVISTDGTIGESDLPFLADDLKESPQGRYHEQLLEYQKQIILSALRECHGNRTEAAKRLGLHRTDFLRRIKNLGLQTHLPLQNKSTDS
ncbi:sigma-54-dependent transcriptional regulator [Candidatus Manganitrophus noduliformans]|uniref:Sigma-54-dependent Fis family transcriptional regulator n=1 Tax=Candidatus Manganitrophus noduliformans TaxID=2606439 RepID=A0A7X6DMZ4_9BACT|nr:sigma-54 dependent transcriptional regulator [Candidatus Manganitrophus noduliformans]NKE70139.1 sigma-54-dependent Fis family transcriptional regulator [Candidatus Manganitrophus noduliformans]